MGANAASPADRWLLRGGGLISSLGSWLLLLAVADHWDRRRLMAKANLFCAGAVAVMLLGTAPGRYWVLYAASAAENCGGHRGQPCHPWRGGTDIALTP